MGDFLCIPSFQDEVACSESGNIYEGDRKRRPPAQSGRRKKKQLGTCAAKLECEQNPSRGVPKPWDFRKTYTMRSALKGSTIRERESVEVGDVRGVQT